MTPPLGTRGPVCGGEYYTPTLRLALWHAFRQHTRGPRPSPVRPNHRPALSRVRDLKPIPPLVQHTSRDYPLHHKYNNNNFLLPAKQKTAQFLAFLFCFTRELNLYTPLTFSLRPPIHPYLHPLACATPRVEDSRRRSPPSAAPTMNRRMGGRRNGY